MGYQLPISPDSVTIAGHTVLFGGSQNLAASDLTNGTTGSGDVVLATSPTIGSPTLSGTVAGSLLWSGSQFFESGQPWADVRGWGAAGNGSTDDTTAVRNAINHMSTTYGGGIVYFPPGTYALNTGITVPNFIHLRGAGISASTLTAGGANTNPVVTITGSRVIVEKLTIYGCGQNASSDPFPATNPTVYVTSNNQDAVTFRDCFIWYGAPSLQANSQDITLDNCFVSFSYSTAIISISSDVSATSGGQIWANRCVFDQSWPVSTPTAAPVTWASLTPGISTVSLGELVTTAAGWLLQCSQAGTIGSTQPTGANYGVSITDGSAKWLFAGSSSNSNAAVSITTSLTSENYFHHCDFTGSYANGFRVTGSGSIHLGIDHCIISQEWNCGLLIVSGANIRITGSELFGGLFGGNGVDVATGFSGKISANDNYIAGSATGTTIGVYVGSTTCASIVKGNHFRGWTYAALMDAGVSDFVIDGNDMTTSNANTVLVASGGSNHYVIANNLIGSNAVSDGGGGGSKFVGNNV